MEHELYVKEYAISAAEAGAKKRADCQLKTKATAASVRAEQKLKALEEKAQQPAMDILTSINAMFKSGQIAFVNGQIEMAQQDRSENTCSGDSGVSPPPGLSPMSLRASVHSDKEDKSVAFPGREACGNESLDCDQARREFNLATLSATLLEEFSKDTPWDPCSSLSRGSPWPRTSKAAPTLQPSTLTMGSWQATWTQ